MLSYKNTYGHNLLWPQVLLMNIFTLSLFTFNVPTSSKAMGATSGERKGSHNDGYLHMSRMLHMGKSSGI